jgi:hypothetical protein
MSEEAKQPDPPDSTKPRRKRMRKSLAVTTQIVVGTGAAIVLVGSLTTPTLGATRSARLVWEARQRQTERELAGECQSDDKKIETDTTDQTSRTMIPSEDHPRGGT